MEKPMHKKFIAMSLLLAMSTTHALTTSYDDEALFVASAGAVNFDSFEELDSSVGTPAAVLARPGYTMSPTLTEPDYGLYVYPAPSSFGAFATDGVTYIVHQTDDGQSLRFDFDAPVHSFGLSITDWDNPAMTAGAELLFGNDAGDTMQITATPLPSGESLFFGIVNTDTAFSWVEILNTASVEAYGIDGVYFSRQVPVPAAVWLLGSALLGGWARLRPDRRRSAHRM